METGTFSAVLPALRASFAGEYLGPYATDTSNALDGLDITFTATSTVERPPATAPADLVLAVKYDKAIAYPPPVMDNGRPT